MATFTEDGEKFVLNSLFKTAGHELCLASNADLDEITDSNYFRVDLTSVLGEPEDGYIFNDEVIEFNVGTQTASWWFVITGDDDKLAFGPLPTPQFGEFRFPVGAIRFEAIAGG